MKLNVRRVLEVSALLATSIALVATSRAPGPCAVETFSVRAVTTCGPEANLTLTSNTGCLVAANGAAAANLPTAGSIDFRGADAGFSAGFSLTSFDADAGVTVDCIGAAIDGGFDLQCLTTSADAGSSCSGTLIQQ